MRDDSVLLPECVVDAFKRVIPIVFLYMFKKDDTLGDFLPYLQFARYLHIHKHIHKYRVSFLFMADHAHKKISHCISIKERLDSASQFDVRIRFGDIYGKSDISNIRNCFGEDIVSSIENSKIVASGEFAGDIPTVSLSLAGDRHGCKYAEVTRSHYFLSRVWNYSRDSHDSYGSLLPPLNTLQEVSPQCQDFLMASRNGSKLVGLFASMDVSDEVADVLVRIMSSLSVLLFVVVPMSIRETFREKLRTFGSRVMVPDSFVEFGKAAKYVDVYANQMGHGSVMWGVVHAKPQIRVMNTGDLAFDKKHFHGTLINNNVCPPITNLHDELKKVIDNYTTYLNGARSFRTRTLREDLGESYLNGDVWSAGFAAAKASLNGTG